MSVIPKPDRQAAEEWVIVWNGRIEELGAAPAPTKGVPAAVIARARAEPEGLVHERPHGSAPPATIAS